MGPERVAFAGSCGGPGGTEEERKQNEKPGRGRWKGRGFGARAQRRPRARVRGHRLTKAVTLRPPCPQGRQLPHSGAQVTGAHVERETRKHEAPARAPRVNLPHCAPRSACPLRSRDEPKPSRTKREGARREGRARDASSSRQFSGPSARPPGSRSWAVGARASSPAPRPGGAEPGLAPGCPRGDAPRAGAGRSWAARGRAALPSSCQPGGSPTRLQPFQCKFWFWVFF